MSDDIDQAQRFDQFRRDLALRARRAGVGELARPSAFGLCEDCIFPIPAARLDAIPGCRRCLTCQEAHERRRRRTQKGL